MSKVLTLIFLHGLDSSGNGTKGHFFAERFPQMLRPDFSGDLSARLARLEEITDGKENLILVGSSYGGLLATVFAGSHPGKVCRLILLAPALNFPEFASHAHMRLDVPVFLVIGRDDVVTPAAEVVPVARRVFSDLDLSVVADDHLLHQTFPVLDWTALLACSGGNQ